MKYILLLRQNPETATKEGTPELDAEMQAWGELYGELSAAGVLVSGVGLESEDAATTLRAPEGKPVLTDGPFAETKELLFSFFILDVADLDAAIHWASKMPNATYGSVEIRPLSQHEQ